MLGPLERLEASAASRAHEAGFNLSLIVFVIAVVAAMYFFPQVIVALLVICALTLLAIAVLVTCFYLYNEVTWVIFGKRF